jgi:hypothetical protein
LTILNQKVRSPTNAFFVFFVKMASPKHKWWAHTSAKQFAFISEEYCSINKDRCSLIANNTFHRSLSNIHYQCIHLYIKRPKSWLSFRFRFKNPEVYLKESIKLSVCTFRWVFFLQWNINLYILYIENMKNKCSTACKNLYVWLEILLLSVISHDNDIHIHCIYTI